MENMINMDNMIIAAGAAAGGAAVQYALDGAVDVRSLAFIGGGYTAGLYGAMIMFWGGTNKYVLMGGVAASGAAGGYLAGVPIQKGLMITAGMVGGLILGAKEDRSLVEQRYASKNSSK